VKHEREQVVSLAMLAGSVQLYIVLMLIYAQEIFFLSLSLGLHTVSFYANLQDGSRSTESILETAHGANLCPGNILSQLEPWIAHCFFLCKSSRWQSIH
jgi:hypothetical protein